MACGAIYLPALVVLRLVTHCSASNGLSFCRLPDWLCRAQPDEMRLALDIDGNGRALTLGGLGKTYKTLIANPTENMEPYLPLSTWGNTEPRSCGTYGDTY